MVKYRECSNCIFYKPRKMVGTIMHYLCRKNPPRVGPGDQHDFALTEPDWWCGEWQRHPLGPMPTIDFPNFGERDGPIGRLGDITDEAVRHLREMREFTEAELKAAMAEGKLISDAKA